MPANCDEASVPLSWLIGRFPVIWLAATVPLKFAARMAYGADVTLWRGLSSV